MIHVALLRGINVGGNNKVPMPTLRVLLEERGFSNVVTYINSGNLVFETPERSARRLALQVEEVIASELDVTCRALVLPGRQIVEISQAIPDHWTNDDTMKADVVYLLDGISAQQASAQLTAREGIDHVVPSRGALCWMTKRTDATRSGLHALVKLPIYQQSTVRNVNTARKLAHLVQERR